VIRLLRGFDRELVADDGCYCVHVTLPSGNGGIASVLNALEEYVRQRGDGPAHINFGGQLYTLEALPRRTRSASGI
jgi:hypothetical protein